MASGVGRNICEVSPIIIWTESGESDGSIQVQGSSRCNNKKHQVKNVWTNRVIQITGQWLDCIYSMTEMRYDTTSETQELMRDASTPTVTSLKLTKRIAQMCANEVFNLRRGINDWKTPGERLG